MRKLNHFVAVIALLGTMPLHAAPDTGLVLHDTGIGQRATGVGATVGVRINLGSDHVVTKSERVKLGLAAGPVFIQPDPQARNGFRRGEASFVGIELKPGYATSLSLLNTHSLAQPKKTKMMASKAQATRLPGLQRSPEV